MNEIHPTCWLDDDSPLAELVIGVHVRRGDKYDNDQDVPVFEQYYLPQILDLSHTLKIRNIFVGESF